MRGSVILLVVGFVVSLGRPVRAEPSPGATTLTAAETTPAVLWTPEQRRYESARQLRFAGIMLVSIGAATAVLGGILVGVDPCRHPQQPSPSSVGDNQGDLCIPIASIFGIPLLAVGGLAVIVGTPLWVVGQVRITEVLAGRSGTGLSIGPGPVGSQGLSLRWRF
jgi:hypothetical protein